MTTSEKLQAARRALAMVADAIVETVREAEPVGAPESAVYLALQSQGASSDQCARIVDALIAAGRIRRGADSALHVAEVWS